MQDLVKITDYKIQRLSELLTIENGDVYFNLIVKAFKSPNKDVENFLKTKAVQATKLNKATTYLVYFEEIFIIKIFTENNKQIWLLL